MPRENPGLRFSADSEPGLRRRDGPRVEFEFRGKGGKFHRVAVEDPRLARIVRRCRELPGQALFEYLDDAGAVQAIGSADVNDYLKEISGAEITAKDFRTWAGTVFVASELARRGQPIGPSHMVAAVREAALLGLLVPLRAASRRPRPRRATSSTSPRAGQGPP